ncbi:DUF3540 domain-containing protein [Sorangium sp. So ce429]
MNATVQMLFSDEGSQFEAVTEFGTVLSRVGRTAQVSTKGGDRQVEIAASCLISPSPGDRVLVAHAGGEAYVLAVLRQREGGEACMVFDRDLSLTVLRGKLRLLAQEGVELVSPGVLDMHVGSVAAKTEQIHVAFSLLDLVGSSIASKSKKVRVVAETFDTIAGRIYQRAINFLRRTDELDRVEAKNIDRRAEQLLHDHGQNTVTTAEHLVKIDAGQVHVG